MPTSPWRKHKFELLAVEAAARAVEGRILGGQRCKAVDGEAKPHLAGLLVEQRAGDDLAEYLLVDAEGARLFARQLGAETAATSPSFWRS